MMVWSEYVFQYCERGHTTLFWAEPFNALSNAAFLIAGCAALAHLRDSPPAAPRIVSRLLIALLFVIATGSFFFHTLATRLAELGDQVPIMIFVLSYFAFALVVLLRIRWSVAVPIFGVF